MLAKMGVFVCEIKKMLSKTKKLKQKFGETI